MARATTAKRSSAPKKKTTATRAPAASKSKTAPSKAAPIKATASKTAPIKATASKTAATAKRAGASKRRSWTKDDVRELKSLAKQKLPTAKIARALKRTEGATRQKAYSLGVSLDSRR